SGASDVLITQTAANAFTVTDNGSTIGFRGVSNIVYTGSTADDTVTLDLAGFTYTGSATFNTGNGDDTVNVLSAGGALRANLTALTGLGNDTVNLNAAGTGGLTVGGNLQLVDQAGDDVLTTGNTAGATIVRGTTSISGFNTITLGFGQADS